MPLAQVVNEDIPDLCAEIERLRVENERLRIFAEEAWLNRNYIPGRAWHEQVQQFALAEGREIE